MAEAAGETRDALPTAALADLAATLAFADDEESAVAAVAGHLARVGLAAGELEAIHAAAVRARDTWHEGQVDMSAGLAEGASAAARLVTTLLAGQLRVLRLLAGQEDMAEERAVLQAVLRRLNAAPDLEAALRAFRLGAPEGDDAVVTLCSVEDGPDGAPAWMTVVANLAAADRSGVTPLGTRFHLPAMPTSFLAMAEPGTPVLISSIADDPRIAAPMREQYARVGLHSVLMLALPLRGRVAGMLTFSWTRPVILGDRERRIFQSLARQAALLVDNNTMIGRLEATLAATQQQGQLLETVLDHIPVGVMCLDAPTRRLVLVNRAAQGYTGVTGSAVDVAEIPAEILHPGTDTPVPPDERPGFRAVDTGQLAHGELDMVPPGGERRALEVTGVPLVGADNKPQRVVLVLSDVTARKREAEARAQLQDEVIRVQAAALAERSSPLIPITDDVLVMPLIGTIDPERGEQILETALTGTRQRLARVTILDVTGVPTLDAQAASVLTNTARALRLLGVEPVLSGVGPHVAQTLVELEVPLAGIVTFGTLQAGIQYALRRLGKRF